MDLLSIDKTLCKKDGMCIDACPVGCIEADAEGYPVEAAGAACIECGHCVAICPHGAISNGRLPDEAFMAIPEATVDAEAVEALMKTRRSVRMFKDRPVPVEQLAKLLDIARYAPTASNSQQLSWVVLQDPAKTRAFAEMTAEWFRHSNIRPRLVEMWDQGREVFLRGAPHLLLACAPKDYRWGAVDCSIALTYMELAAASMGLGVCWGGLPTAAISASEPLARSLPLPEGQTVHGALMVGIPKYRYRRIPPRKAVQAVWV